MIVYRNYDKENRIDRVWYDSSSIVYSECEDKENDYKTLKVVFNNGGTYVYKNVDVNDYVLFVHGGLDGSNGKALNKHIKAKCEFEKLEPTDINSLKMLLKEYTEKELVEK